MKKHTDGCLKESLRIVSYRPYSVEEVRYKLKRKGFDEESIGASIHRLKEYEYLNDTELAKSLIDIKFRISGYGRRKIREYLKRRKVPEDIIRGELDKAVSREGSIQRGVKLLKERQGRRERRILEDKDRLFRYLAARGFELSECVDIISEFEKTVRQGHDG